jgi:molybdopterin converting factor small subunit
MKVVRSSQTRINENSPVCIAIEYPFDDKDINAAVIKIKGRYPDKGRVVNLKCKELVHILNESILLVIEGKKVELKKGDQVLIMPKEKYYWDGNCEILTVCTPAWYPEQHEEVE